MKQNQGKTKQYLFVSETEFNGNRMTGAHRRFLELARAISKTSPVTLISYNPPDLAGMDNITHYPLTERKNPKLPDHIAGMLVLYNALRRYKSKLDCDYVISFGATNTICCKLAGFKHIVSLFREDLIGYQRAAYQASKKRLAYFQLQEWLAVIASEKIIVQCENDRASLIARNQKYCKNVADKVFIQINNANASWMNTGRIARQVNNGDPRILFIGNFGDPRKGHFLLLPAAARLLDEGYRFELLLAGDGAELERCKQRYANYPSIQFLGRVGNMEQYLQQSDFEVVPSLIDSCPNTVLEGLNAGIAVYGANTGGIPDLLREKEYLFEPDEESLYRFLKGVLESKRYIVDAVKQQQRKTELTFDWGRRIQQIIED